MKSKKNQPDQKQNIKLVISKKVHQAFFREMPQIMTRFFGNLKLGMYL